MTSSVSFRASVLSLRFRFVFVLALLSFRATETNVTYCISQPQCRSDCRLLFEGGASAWLLPSDRTAELHVETVLVAYLVTHCLAASELLEDDRNTSTFGSIW